MRIVRGSLSLEPHARHRSWRGSVSPPYRTARGRAAGKPVRRPGGKPLCLAMGVFDGVHRGHQAIIGAAVRMASAVGGLAAVLTFDPHPDAIISPRGAPPLLTTTEEKLALIRGLGVRLAVVADFDRALAATPAQDFVQRILAEQLRARCLVVGGDWRFGAGGEGSIALLRRMAPSLGFQVCAVPAVTVRRRRVSSTWVRALLSQGRLSVVRECLGRYYQVSGRVVPGDQRGRQLGYPTANLDPPVGKLIPPDGVYACWAGVGRPRAAVASIGIRPTFGSGGARRVEVHLLARHTAGGLDWRGKAGRGPIRLAQGRPALLGRVLRVEFVARLRGERRFPSAEALVRQMERDCAQAKRVLALQPPPDMLSSGRQTAGHQASHLAGEAGEA